MHTYKLGNDICCENVIIKCVGESGERRGANISDASGVDFDYREVALNKTPAKLDDARINNAWFNGELNDPTS